MKLHTPPWKTAWYEEGLSERFAQEMTRIERTVAKDIETSAQWVEQLVIELGMLAQNMIHLEGESRRDSQIRLAYEKALKISALAAHLMGALDQAVDRGHSLLRYSAEDPIEGNAPVTGLGDAAFPPPGPAVPHIAQPAAGPVASAPAAAPANPATQQHAQMLRSNAAAQVGIQRQAERKEPPAPPPPPRKAASPAMEMQAPFMSPLIEMSGPISAGNSNGNPMREMILSLSRRGLSRSEIEVITEQPRHVIEAVLSAG